MAPCSDRADSQLFQYNMLKKKTFMDSTSTVKESDHSWIQPALLKSQTGLNCLCGCSSGSDKGDMTPVAKFTLSRYIYDLNT